MTNAERKAWPIDNAHLQASGINGLTKREYFAGLAMQGYLSSGPYDCDERGLAHDAVLQADALLAELERTS